MKIGGGMGGAWPALVRLFSLDCPGLTAGYNNRTEQLYRSVTHRSQVISQTLAHLQSGH